MSQVEVSQPPVSPQFTNTYIECAGVTECRKKTKMYITMTGEHQIVEFAMLSSKLLNWTRNKRSCTFERTLRVALNISLL